ncbi:MAG TPA: M23 family metallopeptidase [Gemmatimonadaceae bacterium]|nr:M23 family metallopeptidase [Gemmatimonadaceae bacterium]
MRGARVVTYTVVAVLAFFALRATPPIAPRPAEVLSQAGVPTTHLRFDTLGRGETLLGLFMRSGLSDTSAGNAVQAATSLDPRRVPAGMPVTIKSDTTDSEPSEITLQLAVDRLLHLVRQQDGSWIQRDERLPWKTDTITVAGTIHSNLYQAMDAAAGSMLPDNARQQLTWGLADIYEYRVDMSRDLQDGDTFKVMAERAVSPTGVTKIGRILVAAMKLSGTETDAVLFTSKATSAQYFDQKGQSLRAAFLHAPLEFRRISSTFGTRFHPILKTWRSHKGTDYAAASGTPVRAIADGVVLRAGWSNGYGNLIEIRHPNGFITRYGHMRGFARGIHGGSRVTIGQTIGYVGMTGLATGPHLHFEVLVNGVQRDPRVALKSTGGQPIAESERVAFTQLRDRLLSQLGGVGSDVATVAQR